MTLGILRHSCWDLPFCVSRPLNAKLRVMPSVLFQPVSALERLSNMHILGPSPLSAEPETPEVGF